MNSNFLEKNNDNFYEENQRKCILKENENNNEIYSERNQRKTIIKNNQNNENINYGIAETISSIILNKIISNVIIISKNNNINKKINNYYFDFLNNLIKPFISIHLLIHEDCYDNDIRPNIDIIYNTIQSRNTWVEIEEPKTSILDRFESIKIKSNFYNNNDIHDNQINESDEYNKDNQQTIYENKNDNYRIKKLLKINKKIENINIKKLLKKDIPVMKFSDLEKEKYENIYINEIENDLLRKEKREKMIKKEKNENIKNIGKKDYIKDKKPTVFDGKALAFDSNGNIIKKIQKENLIKKDFNIIETKIKNIKTIKSFESKSKNLKSNIINDNNNTNTLIEYNDNNNNDYIFDIKNKIRNIIIAENNISNINPEIGVIITNQDKTYKKEGGNNFLLKYNKPSINDFNDILIKTNKLNHQHYLTSNNISGMNYLSNISNLTSYNNNTNTINHKNNNNYEYNGYNHIFNEKNNPLISNAILPAVHSPKNKEKEINIILNRLINKKKLINSNYDKNIKKSNSSFFLNNRNKYNLNEMSYQNTIKISKMISNRSLFNIMDDSDDLYSKKIYNYKSENKNIINNNNTILPFNIIRSYRDKKLPLLNKNDLYRNIEDKNKGNGEGFINRFNYRIIDGNNWGVENEMKGTILNKSKIIKNYFRKQNSTNKIKILNENRLGKINTRKRKINFFQDNSVTSMRN